MHAYMMNKRSVVFVLYAIIDTVAYSDEQIYKTCSGAEYKSSGHTYKIDRDTDQKVWSHCFFPTPTYDHALCGRSVKDGHKYYLCDPDLLLDTKAQEVIDAHLYNIRSNTSTLCTSSSGVQQSFIVAILIIHRIRVPNLKSSALCLNDCNEFQPDLNMEERSPTDGEQNEILRNFADGVRGLWDLGACDNDALVLYCKQFNKMYISTSRQAAKYLTSEKIESMREVFEEDLNSSDFFQTGLLTAMSNLADSLQTVLKATTIAYVLIVSSILAIFAFGAWLVYYLFFRKLETNVWGHETPFQTLEVSVQAVTGIWLIKHILIVMATMSNSRTGPKYGMLFTGLTCLVCFAMYGLS